jgi:dTMP kinase
VTRGGCFVVIEGGEGTGKSTQVLMLGDRLRDLGRPVCTTREPGGTPRGAQIRALLLHDHGDLDPRAEVLLMLADRAQHVAEVVRPQLGSGAVVVSDRYVPSTLAYQGAGRGLGVEEVERLCTWATGGLEPDIVVVLDLPDDVADQRLAVDRDRLERAGAAFHRRVREAYRTLAPLYGWTVVDASGTVDEVAARIWSAVRKILP